MLFLRSLRRYTPVLSPLLPKLKEERAAGERTLDEQCVQPLTTYAERLRAGAAERQR